ncbi:hypothetical protein GCM10018785_67140 [Streptomyces longispororuber]|uniref:Uncharacterized protein n=1 Tax=Streptomyces longispororuber TaxID=68230 RepID=A0A919A872_9ACTN|nr:hypothetical protein [Streptomyces longispororuber]GHE91051.1 hypothetical protein GCM10018785_67140 [Streptomyces longispororuber]
MLLVGPNREDGYARRLFLNVGCGDVGQEVHGSPRGAASEAGNKYRPGDWRDPTLGQETFGEYANRWYAAQDLAALTMQNYIAETEARRMGPRADDGMARALDSGAVVRAPCAMW